MWGVSISATPETKYTEDIETKRGVNLYYLAIWSVIWFVRNVGGSFIFTLTTV